MSNLWEKWLEVFSTAQPTTYDTEGQGVPAPSIWQGREIWRFDGTSHCSGAVWWALLELLRRNTDLEEDAKMGLSQIESLRKAAWVFEGTPKAGLPLLLGLMELGVYGAQVRPEQSDICQAYRPNRTGHLFVCAGYDEQGNLLEWSASESHPQGTGIKAFVGPISEIHVFRFYDWVIR